MRPGGLIPDPFTPASAVEGQATLFQCALCGQRFTHGGRVCAACLLGSDCNLVKCPRCGYAFPRSSRLVDWWRGWRARRKERA